MSEGLPTLWQRILDVNLSWKDWLFVPLVAQFLFVNFALYPRYPEFIFGVGTFQSPANEIFPYTWSSALALFVYSVWLFHRRYHVDLVRTFIYALGLVFAATSLFEVIYQNIGAGQGIGNQQIEGQLINLSSIAFGLSSARFWRPTRSSLFALNVFLAGWVLWMSAGYPQIQNGDPVTALHAYAFNVALKVGAYVVIGLFVSFAPRVSAERPSAGTPSEPWDSATSSRPP